MSTRRQNKRLGKENLQRIIDLCRSIEERGTDPFSVDVDNILEIIHRYFPEWENHEELCLDAEALHQIASAIKLQSEWVRHRSTSLYTDPFLIEEKLRKLPNEGICTIFLESWRPIVEFEQVSPNSLVKAIEYWRSLIPLDERWQKSESKQIETAAMTREELLRKQIIAEKEFSSELDVFWEELRHKTMSEEKIEYWSFIGAKTYGETIKRAYLTSFLVTYGYATMEVDRLEEIVYIKPCKKPISPVGKQQAISLPISINIDNWNEWKEGVKE